MSSDMIAQVLRLSNPDLTRPQHHLLLVLAYHTNHETGLAYPGYRLLAQECLLTVRQVINLVHRLEKAGWIEVHRGQGRGHLTVFRLALAGKVIHRKGEISTMGPLREKVKSGREKVKSTPVPLTVVVEPQERKTSSALSSELKPETRHRFWCEGCGVIIQACVHRIVAVDIRGRPYGW